PTCAPQKSVRGVRPETGPTLTFVESRVADGYPNERLLFETLLVQSEPRRSPFHGDRRRSYHCRIGQASSRDREGGFFPDVLGRSINTRGRQRSGSIFGHAPSYRNRSAVRQRRGELLLLTAL